MSDPAAQFVLLVYGTFLLVPAAAAAFLFVLRRRERLRP